MDDVQKELAKARLEQTERFTTYEKADEARMINEGIADYEAGRVVDGKKSLKKMRDKYGV